MILTDAHAMHTAQIMNLNPLLVSLVHKICSLVSFKDCCFHIKSGVTSLSIADDSETNNIVCQAMLASFTNAVAVYSRMPWCQIRELFYRLQSKDYE